MVEENKNLELQNQDSSSQVWKSLESDIISLIQKDNRQDLADLAHFKEHLSGDKKIVVSKQILQALKADLENGKLIDFEWGTRNDNRFGFETLGRDVKPTITPAGDVLVPVNFWYDAQRRTKILVLNISEKDGTIEYFLPSGNNAYEIAIWKEVFIYDLYHQDWMFYLKIRE